MKKSAIFTIVACSLVVLILGGVLAIGLTSDGFGVINLLNWEHFGDEGDGKLHEYSETWDAEDVDSLNVGWINGDVNLVVGSGNQIVITERANRELEENQKMRLSESGGTLKIKWNDEFISLGIFHNLYKELTVEVPKELADRLEDLNCSNTSGTVSAKSFLCEEGEFSSTSGSLELEDIQAGTLEVSSTSGTVRLKRLTGEKLDVSGTSGQIEGDALNFGEAEFSSVSGGIDVAGSFENLSASTVSGSTRLESAVCPSEADLNSVSGSLELFVPKNDGFDAEYSSVSGSFSSDFPTSGDSGKSGRVLYESGKASFRFSTTSGSMFVGKITADS